MIRIRPAVFLLSLLVLYVTCNTNLLDPEFSGNVDVEDCGIVKGYITNRYETEKRSNQRGFYLRVIKTSHSQLSILFKDKVSELIKVQVRRSFNSYSSLIQQFKLRWRENLKEHEEVVELFEQVRKKVTRLVTVVGASVERDIQLGRGVEKLNQATNMTSSYAAKVAKRLAAVRQVAKILTFVQPSHPNYFVKVLQGAYNNSKMIHDNLVLQMKVNRLELRGIQADQNQGRDQIKFHVRQGVVVNTSSSNIFTFDTVIYNAGDGYDYKTGIFTAPRAGNYSLWARFFCSAVIPFNMTIVKNGIEMSRKLCTSISSILSENLHEQTMYLKNGDRVWFGHDDVEYVLGIGVSRYGGFLL